MSTNPLFDDAPARWPPQWMDHELQRERVERWVRRANLTDKQATAVQLYLFSRSGFRRVAAVMGLSPSGARDLVRRGLDAIRQDIRRRGEFDSLHQSRGLTEVELG